MNNPVFLVIIFFSVLIFGVTSLIIFRQVRQKNNELVESTAFHDKKYLGTQNVDFGKYFQIYKEYHKEYGWNYILILNVISYPTFLISAICDTFLLKG